MSHDSTYTVLDALPEEQKRFWHIEGAARVELKKVLCLGDPDRFCGLKGKDRAQAAEYFFFFDYPGDRQARNGLNNDGRLFHYLPVDTGWYEGCGAWQSDSINKWEFVHAGFSSSLKTILGHIEKGDVVKALISTMPLIHFLQDQTAFFHSLEGEEGCAPWILNELVARAPDAAPPVSLLTEQAPEIDISDYSPEFLGTCIPEICFHLYRRYRDAKQRNRLRLLPMVQAAYAGDTLAEYRIRGAIEMTTAEIVLDLLDTVYRTSTRDVDRRQLRALSRVHLADLRPINYPGHVSGPYRFNSMVRNYALDSNQRRRRLRIRVKSGDSCREKVFARGIGTGCHREVRITYPIPKAVFARLKGHVGLHSRLGKRGSVEVDLRFRRKRLFRELLDWDNPSVPLDVDVAAGGLLDLYLRSRTGTWSDSENNLVLADPCLLKH